jgi:hypothetical protein
MFDTDRLHDENLTTEKRRRLYGPYPLQETKITHALFSSSKGIIYFMCGAAKIVKVYARADHRPFKKFSHCIVSVAGSEHLEGATVRALDAIDHVGEQTNGRTYFYSRLIVHTNRGACTILCQDPPALTQGHACLQLEECDQYPPSDAAPLTDFSLPLPSVREAHV